MAHTSYCLLAFLVFPDFICALVRELSTIKSFTYILACFLLLLSKSWIPKGRIRLLSSTSPPGRYVISKWTFHEPLWKINRKNKLKRIQAIQGASCPNYSNGVLCPGFTFSDSQAAQNFNSPKTTLEKLPRITASLTVISSVGGDLRGRNGAVSFPEDIPSRDWKMISVISFSFISSVYEISFCMLSSLILSLILDVI